MIENAKKEELPEILDFVNDCVWSAYNQIFSNLKKEDLSYKMEHMIEIFEGMLVYVYKDDGKIIGTIALSIVSKNRGQLRIVYVHPEHQRKGIGTSLVNYVEDIAREMAIKELFVSTIEKAQSAMNFYQKLGYQITEKEERDWGIYVFLERKL